MFDFNSVTNRGKSNADSSPEAPSQDTPEARRTTGTGLSKQPATIGPSIHIKGELSGEEDLIIEGTIEGTVNLKENDLTVGAKGSITADVYAQTITIDGTLKGDLYGVEKVTIRKSGDVRGNVFSPRVTIEEGAKFKGSIDMEADIGKGARMGAGPKVENSSNGKTPGNDKAQLKSA